MTKNYINYLYWLAMLLLILSYAYMRGWILVDFKSLDAKKIETMLREDDNVTLLDVRSALEFEREHIADAKLIPLSELSDNIAQLQPLKSKKIIVYCHSGSRSIRAARLLKAEGFVPVNLDGGLLEWKKEGLPLVVNH